jgi:hypothetical protein
MRGNLAAPLGAFFFAAKPRHKPIALRFAASNRTPNAGNLTCLLCSVALNRYIVFFLF